MKLNRQGFTLVELLAALVILALLMAAAVPNVIGMINRNKATSYIEDAKKLAARAEYLMRGDMLIWCNFNYGFSSKKYSVQYAAKYWSK